MFDQELYHKEIATAWLGRSFYFFDELPSTSTYCKSLKEIDCQHGAVYLTDYQTGGRGQHNRAWETTKGENLTFSLVLKPDRRDGFILLTLACAYSVVQVLNSVHGIHARIKWPNDVLIKEKKACGILTETQFTGNKLDKVIIGIGLNVNQESFSPAVSALATSVKLKAKQQINREKLLADILQQIEKYYLWWEEFKPELPRQINRELIGFGKWVRLKVNNEILEGKHKFLGIDEMGRLLTLNDAIELNTYTYEQVRVLL